MIFYKTAIDASALILLPLTLFIFFFFGGGFSGGVLLAFTIFIWQNFTDKYLQIPLKMVFPLMLTYVIYEIIPQNHILLDVFFLEYIIFGVIFISTFSMLSSFSKYRV